ncbi:MAG: hypothetical protein WC538_18785 [Thermoanaerobaculia bacterium]
MIALTGRYCANCAVLALPAADAASMLSGNAELGDQTLTPPGTHPVVLLMGEHTGVRVKFLPGSIDYREALVSVPWVRRREGACGSGPLAHVSRLWLDRLAPVVGGWTFGFPKIWSHVEMSDTAYGVQSILSRTPLLDARFVARGAAAPPAQFDHFGVIRPIFEQPFLQRLLLLGPSCVEVMDFGLGRATLQPIEATIEVRNGFMDGFPVGARDLKSIEESPFGAFRLELAWTLTAPMSCASATLLRSTTNSTEGNEEAS